MRDRHDRRPERQPGGLGLAVVVRQVAIHLADEDAAVLVPGPASDGHEVHAGHGRVADEVVSQVVEAESVEFGREQPLPLLDLIGAAMDAADGVLADGCPAAFLADAASRTSSQSKGLDVGLGRGVVVAPLRAGEQPWGIGLSAGPHFLQVSFQGGTQMMRPDLVESEMAELSAPAAQVALFFLDGRSAFAGDFELLLVNPDIVSERGGKLRDCRCGGMADAQDLKLPLTAFADPSFPLHQHARNPCRYWSEPHSGL